MKNTKSKKQSKQSKFSAFIRSKRFVAFAVVATVTISAVSFISASYAAFFPDCDANAIMKCGAETPAQFVQKAKTNTPNDLDEVYAHWGLTTAEYSRFSSSARPATVYRDGKVVVDGQTVGTDAWTLGRNTRPNQKVVSVAGKTYYLGKPQDSFAAGVKSLPGMAMFAPNGTIEFLVLNSCGNPVTITQNAPKYACTLLNKETVKGKLNTYNFWTSATASNNATITKVVYDFGDGTTVTETSPTKKVTHTYAKQGNYVAKVTVYASVPGKQTVSFTAGNCQQIINVVQPFHECVALNARVTSPRERSYEFKATYRQGNGAKLTSAQFDFGDGQKATGVKPSSNILVQTNHSYAKAGSYTTTATLTFSTPEGNKTTTCQVLVNISPDACAIKPSVPKDSPECKPCPLDQTLPADSPSCTEVSKPEPPQELPVTGIGAVAAVFGGVAAIGALLHHLHHNRKTKLF